MVYLKTYYCHIVGDIQIDETPIHKWDASGKMDIDKGGGIHQIELGHH
jgi:hypothetical protein